MLGMRLVFISLGEYKLCLSSPAAAVYDDERKPSFPPVLTRVLYQSQHSSWGGWGPFLWPLPQVVLMHWQSYLHLGEGRGGREGEGRGGREGEGVRSGGGREGREGEGRRGVVGYAPS